MRAPFGKTLAMISFLAFGLAAGACPPLEQAPANAMELADAASSCAKVDDWNGASILFALHSSRLLWLERNDDPALWAQRARQTQAQLGAPVNEWNGKDLEAWARRLEAAAAWGRNKGCPEARLKALICAQASADSMLELAKKVSALAKAKGGGARAGNGAQMERR